MIRRLLRNLLSGDGLKERAQRGSIIAIFNIAGSTLMRLASNLVLTRILFPEAFGIMAIVQIVMQGVSMVSDVGLRVSIVQHERGDDPAFLNTAWTMQIIRGAFLSLVIALLAPSVAAFYDEPILATLLPVAGLAAFIGGFKPTRQISANRHLRLGRVTTIGLANQAVTLIITALLAYATQSVWGLVYGSLIGGLIHNISIRVFIPGEPNRLAFDRSAFRDIFGTGKFILLSTLATFLVNSGDRALLGKFISLDLLGIYAIALNLASMPMLLAKQFSRRIIFPLYSRKPPMENLDNRRNILKARYALTSAAFAASMALAVVGVPVVEFLYDTRYELAGAITVLLAVSMMPVVALSGHDSILLANNKAGTYTVLTVANALLRLAVLIIGINYFGILGAAVAPFIATVLHYPLLVILTRKYGAWDPKYDFLFFVLIVIAVGVVWAINAEAILAIPRETVISVF